MLSDLLSRLTGRRPAPYPPVDVDGGAVWLVGDVHGRHDLLSRLLDRVARAVGEGAGPAALVTLGDYVDRGPDSAAVLDALRSLPGRVPVEVVALAGNHERMMLDYLDHPERAGRAWLRHGGAATTESFGAVPPDPDAGSDAMRAGSAALRAALPAGTEDWLRGLPTLWRRGTLVCVHAGLDPARAPGDQKPATPIWGHRDFARLPRTDGLWVAHGHTVVPAPSAQAGRIAVDTGAWRTDRLTMARIGPAPGAVAFETA